MPWRARLQPSILLHRRAENVRSWDALSRFRTSDAVRTRRRWSCRMRGRTVLITVASSGLGYEAALKLARLGANVVMVARDAQRGETALAAVKAFARPASASLPLCDMASLAAVRALAKDVAAHHDRLDVLC